jgi:hypothetical protein
MFSIAMFFCKNSTWKNTISTYLLQKVFLFMEKLTQIHEVSKKKKKKKKRKEVQVTKNYMISPNR